MCPCHYTPVPGSTPRENLEGHKSLSPCHFLKSLSHSCHKHFWGTKHLAHPEPDNVSPLLSTPLFLNPLQAPLEASITSVQHQRITWVEGADLSSGIGLYHQSPREAGQVTSYPSPLAPLCKRAAKIPVNSRILETFCHQSANQDSSGLG